MKGFTGKFRKALLKLIQETLSQAVTGTVKSVDEASFTCVVTPTGDGADYQEVRLKSAIDDSDAGVVCIPDVGSEVVISPLYNNDHAYYVSRFSKIKKWHLKAVSGRSLEFTQDGKIKINGESLGGLTKAGVVATKINTLETAENAFKTIVAAINSAGAGSPGTPVTNGTLAAFFAAYNVVPIAPLTIQAQLESTNVKHG